MPKTSPAIAALLLISLLAIEKSSCCQDDFVNIMAKVKPHNEAESHFIKLNGCIERTQIAFKGKNMETIEIENQVQKSIKKDSVRHMTKLKFLRIDNSSLESIDPEAFRNLIRIHEIMIRRNNIPVIEGGTFARDMPLAVLDLSCNHIQTIKGDGFSNMRSLRKLRLNVNELTNLDPSWFKNSTAMEVMHIDHNKITKIVANTFANFPKLRDVHLEFNEISTIEPNAFKNVHKLAYLNLRYNKLTTLQANIFPQHITISKVYLSANWINFLPKALMDKLEVGLLTLDGNPMLCSCMNPVRDWMKESNGNLTVWTGCFDDTLPVCVFPRVHTRVCDEIEDTSATKEYFDRVEKSKVNSNCFRLDFVV